MGWQLANSDAAALDLGHDLVLFDRRIVEGEVLEDVAEVAQVGVGVVRRLIHVVVLRLLLAHVLDVLDGVVLARVVRPARVVIDICNSL